MVTDIITNKKLLVALWLLFGLKNYSQSPVGVGIGTATPKALLDISSTDVKNGGVLIPRYNVDDISTLNLEAEHDSMLFYIQPSASGITKGTGVAINVTSPGFYFYDHDSQTLLKLNSSKDTQYSWNLLGNTDTTDHHFIGTKVNVPVKIKVNDTFSGYIGEENVSLGYNSLSNLITNKSSGINNIALGANAIPNLTTGTDNIGIGYSSLSKATIAEDNIAIGNSTLASVIDGTDNIAIGTSVLRDMPSGRYNIGIGGRVMQEASGTTRQNIGIGYKVLNKVSIHDAYNVGIGYGVLENGVDVRDNVSIGRSTGAKLITGYGNVTIGREALENAETAYDNVILGKRSAEYLINGTSNVVIGLESMQVATSGTDNIVIGHRSARNLIEGTNNIVIGTKADVSSDNVSNQVTIGNPLMTAYRMWTNGWTNVSDRRTKNNIEPLNIGLKFINELSPSKFVYKNDSTNKLTYGFIAQDVEKALKDNNILDSGLVQNFSDGTLGLRMNDFIPILTKAIQDQNEIIELQQKEISQLKTEIDAIKAALNIK
jgi:trimeric autotransporter adhesin